MPEYNRSRKDRARKDRIRRSEIQTLVRKAKKLDAITSEQKSELKKLVAANARGEMLSTSSVANWRDLRAMGVVREDEGKLIVTTVGMKVASEK